jgi:hypothetical protein
MNEKLNKIRQMLAAILLIAAVEGFSSCEKVQFTLPVADPDMTVYFQADVQPIFNANCITCHNGTKAPDLRDGKSYKYLTTYGYVNLPGETSRLYSHMLTPEHSPRSTANDKSKILNWINQGALNN